MAEKSETCDDKMLDAPCPLITVLTTTYNRRPLLSRLFASIEQQDIRHGSVEWLVIDDGSTDGTASDLEDLQKRHPHLVRYKTFENSGKCRALNRGSMLARGRWILIIDSDDWLEPGAVSRAIALVKECDGNPAIGAIVNPYRFPRNSAQNRFLLARNPCSYAERLKLEPTFETCTIFRTSVMREFPFPEVPGEKFMAEGWQHCRIGQEYLTFLSNDYLIGVEYQSDGLSANSLRLRSHSAISAALVYSETLKQELGWRLALRTSLNLHRFYWHARWRGKRPSDWNIPTARRFLLPGLVLFVLDQIRLSFL